MSEDLYTQRKWELFWQWQSAFPRFPKIGINRKQKLVRLIAEHERISLDKAKEIAEMMQHA